MEEWNSFQNFAVAVISKVFLMHCSPLEAVSFISSIKVPLWFLFCLAYASSSHKTASASITIQIIFLRQSVGGAGLIDKMIN